MTLIRVDDHRISLTEIARWRPVLSGETEAAFKTEIELSSGSTFYVKVTPEQIDEYMTHNVSSIERIPR